MKQAQSAWAGRPSQTLLAHEWLAPHGGSENVFESISKAFPEASRVCLWNDAPERFTSNIRETWLARTPLRRSKAAALPFLSRAWRSIDLSGYDRVITSSHAFSHHLATRAADQGIRAFAYVHTPARYVWSPELDERGDSAAARAVASYLKGKDLRRTSARVSYAANSEFVRKRIADTWGRDARVIYPPVNVEGIQAVADWTTELTESELQALEALPADFVLGASRLIEYKRLDLSMRVGEALDLPVVIAGSGPLEPELRCFGEAARVPVIFLGRVSDRMLYALYQRTALFVFMAIEDFGIMPVEAMAAGAPVLVNELGGASESVAAIGGGTAVSADASLDSLRHAARRALATDRLHARREALAFGTDAFRTRLVDWCGSAEAPS